MAFPFDLGTVVTAIGALGAASFTLVDATKIGRNGGVSNAGFACIEAAVGQLFPGATRKPGSMRIEGRAAVADDERKLLDMLHGHWINGSPLAEQKAIAKSLIKLRLTSSTAEKFAAATSVDAEVLAQVAVKMMEGARLSDAEMNVLGRFDLALTAILDEGYQRADQRYRNTARALASGVAVVLAVVGGFSVSDSSAIEYLTGAQVWQFVLCGLLATPLAPVAKDVANGLAAGVKVAQAIRR
jgi:hypothetical protein